MKNQIQKLFVFFLSLSLLSITLLGCSSKITTSSSIPKDRTEVKLWYSGGKTATSVFQELVDSFNDAQTTYYISTTVHGDYKETYTNLQAAIAGKNAPDMVLLDADKTATLSKKGVLEELTPYIEADQDFQREDFLDVFFQQGSFGDDKLYALPVYGTTQLLYYNKAAFQESNIDPQSIKTWQDLAKAAQTMTKKDGDNISFYGWEPMYGKDNLIDAAFSNGAKLLSEDGKTVLINNPEWVDVWDSFGTWIHEDQIMKVHFGGQGWEYWYKTMEDVLQNRAGGYTGSSGDQADLDFSIVGALEQPGFGEQPSAPVARALQLTILKSGAKEGKQGAYEFMKFFTSASIQGKWSMETGYIPVVKSTLEDKEYLTYLESHPQALIPYEQSLHSSILPIDPTGNKIYDALKIAADKVELEHISAQEALDEACKVAQEALDQVEP